MSRIEKILMHGGTIALGITGILYAVFKHLVVNDDPFSAYNHPLQPWMLTLHVLAAPVLVFAVGSIFRDHILAMLKGGAPGRKGGVGTMAIVIPLIISGYLIQVLSSEGPRGWSAWIHLGLGIAFLVFYAVHVLGAFGRAARRRAAGSTPGPGSDSDATLGGAATIWGRRARGLARLAHFPIPQRRASGRSTRAAPPDRRAPDRLGSP